ncbi:MAG: dihydroorotate dehydrogenase (quinone), partial [Saprospiraceae bacterium]|nr:dihydroorotate dehydrogenase (quinone) [Saprospiraceae bacterium]
MYQLLKPILFLFRPERAHHFTTSLLQIVLRMPLVGKLFRLYWQLESTSLERNIMGLHFRNPIGLAAGFDKDA